MRSFYNNCRTKAMRETFLDRKRLMHFLRLATVGCAVVARCNYWIACASWHPQASVDTLDQWTSFVKGFVIGHHQLWVVWVCGFEGPTSAGTSVPTPPVVLEENVQQVNVEDAPPVATFRCAICGFPAKNNA
eukprot:5072712-Amphidinium_carterae.2